MSFTDRRKFLKIATGTAAASCHSVIASGTSAPDITSLLLANGFDPAAEDAALLAVASDLHIYLDPLASTYTTEFDTQLVDEINGLAPGVTHLILAGDLASSHSLTVGTPRYASSYALARQELAKARQEIDRFRPDLAKYLIPGNHDQDKWETDAELWRELVHPETYHHAILGGVPVFFLNSGHAGKLDAIQTEWFRQLAADIDPEQEVLIIAHHPSLFYLAGEFSLKLLLTELFAGRPAPVWAVGGHGHGFVDQHFTHKGTSFIQTQITTANRKSWGDGNLPGYGLVALEGGKVRARIFRSLRHQTFNVRARLPAMPSKPLVVPFDSVEYPALICIEGSYDRTGAVIEFLANDVSGHFAYLQHILYRANLEQFRGKAADFLLLAGVNAMTHPTVTVAFSDSGPSGPWTLAVLPPPREDAVYRVPLPEEMRNSAELHIRVETSITRYGASFTIGGWGLAAKGSELNGYERWISRNHRTLSLEGEAAPSAVPDGSEFPNAEIYAFGLTLSGDPDPDALSGAPVQGGSQAQMHRFSFARRKQIVDPGIRYIPEDSSDLLTWHEVADHRQDMALLNDEWEEIGIDVHPDFPWLRVRLEPEGDGGAWAEWPGYAMASNGTSEDRNADGLPDLVDFAFGLEGRRRSYDPDRLENPSGLPVLRKTDVASASIRFTRFADSRSSAVSYRLEEEDRGQWVEVDPALIRETILEASGDRELVEWIVLRPIGRVSALRIRTEIHLDP